MQPKVLTGVPKEKTIPTHHKAQKIFRWSYTPEWKKKGLYQMLLGDYIRQREAKQK